MEKHAWNSWPRQAYHADAAILAADPTQKIFKKP